MDYVIYCICYICCIGFRYRVVKGSYGSILEWRFVIIVVGELKED